MLEYLDNEKTSPINWRFYPRNKSKNDCVLGQARQITWGIFVSLIDEETYKRKKEKSIQQKISLKSEKYTLG